jgi:hypothetical protein
MLDSSALAQRHAPAIVDALVGALNGPDGRTRLRAAKLLLGRGWGSPADPRLGAPSGDLAPADGLSPEKLRQAIDLMRTHLQPANELKPATTPCPAGHEAAGTPQPPTSPHADPATNPMSPEPTAPGAPPPQNPKNTPLAEPALTPCPAAAPLAPDPAPPPNPSINPMSRERSPSPLAAPPGTDPPRPNPDVVAHALLLARQREDAFRRPLPQPPPVEPPRPFFSDAQWQSGRHRRWR